MTARLSSRMAVGVVGAEGVLGDLQGALLQGQRLVGLPQSAVGEGQVVQPDGRAGVVGAEGVLGDLQGALLQGQRLVGLPQIAVGEGQVVQPDGRAGVVGAEGVLGDLQGALLQGQRLVGLDPHRFRRHHPKWHDGLRGENRKWDRLARSTPRNIRTRLWSW